MSHITTISGRKIDPRDETPDFHMPDIAYALSRITRYNGHQRQRWSVAQHSICCAHLVAPQYAREALLHDATEAYLCDVPTPLKQLLPDYQELEARLDRAFRKWADLPRAMSDAVREADRTMLVAESFLLHPQLYDEMQRPALNEYAVDLVERYATLDERRVQDIFCYMAAAS